MLLVEEWSLSSTSTTGFQFVKRQFALVADGDDDPYALLLCQRGTVTRQPALTLMLSGQQIVKRAGKRNGRSNVSDGHRIFLT